MPFSSVKFHTVCLLYRGQTKAGLPPRSPRTCPSEAARFLSLITIGFPVTESARRRRAYSLPNSLCKISATLMPPTIKVCVVDFCHQHAAPLISSFGCGNEVIHLRGQGSLGCAAGAGTVMVSSDWVTPTADHSRSSLKRPLGETLK